ncbi:MAG: tetratricopeptide repeat protein [Eggerthellaceae bacterium]|nr:tetratricopeptide repeat protein [Eggerthellaceae bacterium]
MNTELYNDAQNAYSSGEVAGALDLFTRCLQDAENPPAEGESGLLYHRIGNCLMKLKDYDEAIHAYTQATADASYEAIGQVNYNLGSAYAALRDYENAVKHFEIAVSDRNYDAPYKAYIGMGKANLKLGNSAEAGSAFRAAALDEANPNPANSLLNLGICFMALGRPADAVQSYESALQFYMDAETKNKLYANLGQAYTASGKMEKAVEAFEKALADKTYFLNDAASVDYQTAVGAVAQGTAEIKPVGEGDSNADTSGLDITADGAPLYHETDMEAAAGDPHYFADDYEADDNYANGGDRFFNASDEELEKWSRGVMKQDRKRRNVGLKILVAIFVILLLAALAGVFAYTQGYGYPSQQTVVRSLFTDKNNAAHDSFAEEIDSATVQTMLDPVVTDPNVQIDSVERSMNTSVVYATASTPEGGQIHYRVSLTRDGLGWRMTNVELYFPSQN